MQARLKLIADDDVALAELQKKMADDMIKAEIELDEKMKERKKDILALKKQNLEDRIRMAQDELSDFQIKEMRAQLNREYEQLEAVIANEKEKQLRGMKAAMLERRIKKERKRKAELAELRQQELRAASNKVTDLMAKALKNKIMF